MVPMPDPLTAVLMAWTSSRLFGRRGLTLCLPISLPIVGKGSIRAALTSRIPAFLYLWCMREMIGLAYERVQERMWEVDSRFVHHERRLPSIAARLRSHARLRSLEQPVADTLETFSDGHLESSPSGIVVWALNLTGDD